MQKTFITTDQIIEALSKIPGMPEIEDLVFGETQNSASDGTRLTIRVNMSMVLDVTDIALNPDRTLQFRPIKANIPETVDESAGDDHGYDWTWARSH